MISRNKITISFLPCDNDLWEFIQNKKETCNVSEYIRSLIRHDMYVDNSATFNEEKILEKILQTLQNSNNIELPATKTETIEDMLINEGARNTINSLF
ncbi:hypothetical protein [Peribacillus asahii]|uniref:hypothetical protein n=1 Tax=Peribacillus asahii TaxID=228899 RepID=UPI0020794B97|nr:hypothetical protein [Peribacillus asahii]USK60394.1 hypothetical protein LIT37_03315 [Peribacillus asahii]